jgi:hypothetical protein
MWTVPEAPDAKRRIIEKLVSTALALELSGPRHEESGMNDDGNN